MRGSEISADNNVNLKAEGDVLLESSQDKATLHSSNKSSGGSIGVGISLGSSNGITLSAGVNAARGNANGDDVIQQNTHVVAGNTVTIQSGADTTLAGATVTAPTVKADVGGDLNIESRQDTSSFESQQKSAGAGVTLCIPPICYGTSSVSVSGGKQNIDSNLQSVTEQSGIRAGDGGFQVNVAQDTTLTGGAITSTDKAVNEGKNSFNTGGSLTMSDVQNHAQYQGEGFEFNATLASNSSRQEIPKGHESRVQHEALAPKTGGSAGIGEDSGSASSVTTSGISGIAGNEAMRTGDAETGIRPIFDKEKVQRELNAQIKITAEFGKQASKIIGDRAAEEMSKVPALRAQGRDAEAKSIEDAWGEYGTLRLLAHTVVGGLTGGASGAAGAVLGTMTAPTVANALHEAGITGPLADMLIAAASTAAGAVAGGVNGAVTAGNEVVNNYLTHNQAREKEKKLASAETEDDRKRIIQEYAQLDEKQREEAGMCLVNDQCQSVFDKESLKSVLAELNAACSPPHYCTADEKSSIQELNQFYAIRESIKPDTTFEELLLGNKIIGSALKGVVALYGKLARGVELDGLGGVVSREATGVEFGKGINAQGKPFESYVQSKLPEGTIDLNIIKNNFKTFDHLTPDGVAISTKTLDTVGSVTYQNSANITRQINGYVDDMVTFLGDWKKGGLFISAEDITAKQMQLAIPYATTPFQMAAINQSIQYAASRGITIIVTRLR